VPRGAGNARAVPRDRTAVIRPFMMKVARRCDDQKMEEQ
jgi:hypothetical protein